MPEEKTTEFGEEEVQADTENENSAASSAGEETDQEESTQSDEGGENTQSEQEKKDRGFADDPRWQEREERWKERFNDQESRHTEDMRKLREEFGISKKDIKDSDVEIPEWFGGDKSNLTPAQMQVLKGQYMGYLKDMENLADKRAEEKLKTVTERQQAEETAVAEATTYMQSEIKSIESDKTINPTGIKVDPNKLAKFVMDNYLVDSKNRWNWRLGFKFMTQGNGSGTNVNKDRKQIGGATTTDSKGEDKKTAFKTSKDFKNPSNRPW